MNQHTHHDEGPDTSTDVQETPPAAGDPDLAKIRALIARSSLGTTGATALRERTAPELAEVLRHLTDLRNRTVHSAPLTRHDLVDLTTLADQCEKLGLHDLARWAYAELAAAHLERLARSLEAEGNHDIAATWRARAATLHQSPATDRKS
jgi:hypothetical protein